MSETTPPQVVRNYLAQLDSELAGVSDSVARDIRRGIAEELEGLDATASAERIEQLGDPAFIAAEARAASPEPIAATRSSSVWYIVAAGLLIAFIPFAGWVAGLTMVWVSRVWRTWEKVVATTIAPVLAFLIGFGLTGRLTIASIGYLLPPVFLMVGAWLLVVGLHRIGELRSSRKSAP